MLDTIISSKTRVKLLIKFFLIRGSRGYLRGLERQFHETSNAIRTELNRFEKAGLLTSCFEGRRKVYEANQEHLLYNDINNIVRKTVGIDQIVERIVSRIDNLEEAYITGSFAMGVDSDTIEMALVGRELSNAHINRLVKISERLIGRKIMYLTLTPDQMEHFFKDKPVLLIWEGDKTLHPTLTAQ